MDLEGERQASGQAAEASRLLEYHLSLLKFKPYKHEFDEASTAPLFSLPVINHVKHATTLDRKAQRQYGLLAGVADMLEQTFQDGNASMTEAIDPRIFFNVTAPSSIFICGSQGSGKSHTLSCILENCLLSSDVNNLTSPLTGLVFHYDTFISDEGGSPCEAAYLASDCRIKVRVLCSPTNIRTMKRTYGRLGIQVEPLQIDESDLNTKRMLDLMAVSSNDGPMPLYLHAVSRILRELRLFQQQSGATFSYREFRRRLDSEPMTPAQLAPLKQRLDMLESFMTKHQTETIKTQKIASSGGKGTDWSPKAGCLSIVDLSCPCITPESACSLFNICLSIFLEQDTRIGRVVALDEAHKYMDDSAEATTLTNTILSTVRLQRHLGARVIISTQEPTISPALLDLSSVTIVHRFTSPEWLRALKQHLAPVASNLFALEAPNACHEKSEQEKSRYIRQGGSREIFDDIVKLRVGEALLFAPNALVALEVDNKGRPKVQRLDFGYLKIRVRARLTTDGGMSVMAY